jgi:8-oxo-dGTP diphosphatase
MDQVPFEKMWEDDKFWLPLVFERKEFQTRWIFDDDRMLDQHIELVK